jgi:hypothetical protein
VHSLFPDSKQAYDAVNGDYLRKILSKFGSLRNYLNWWKGPLFTLTSKLKFKANYKTMLRSKKHREEPKAFLNIILGKKFRNTKTHSDRNSFIEQIDHYMVER